MMATTTTCGPELELAEERSTNFLPSHTVIIRPVCPLNQFRSGPGPLSVVCTHRDELLHLRCPLPMAHGGIQRSSLKHSPALDGLRGAT